MATAKLIKKGESANGEWFLLVKQVEIDGWKVDKSAFVAGVPGNPKVGDAIEIPSAVDKLIKWE